MKKITKKDLKVLAVLRSNSRQTLTSISKITGIPVSTIYDKIRYHKKNNLLRKNTSLIDFSRLGFTAITNILLKVKRDQRESLIEFVKRSSNVNTVRRINNGYDVLIETIFPNLRYFEDFMERMESKFDIEKKQVYYIIEDLKREEFFTKPSHTDLVRF